MTYALIGPGNAWLSGPLPAAPEPGNGERVVVVAAGYPDGCLWSPARGGFVDVVGPVTRLSRIAYQRLFTQGERIAIRASTDAVVVDFRELAALAETIDLDDADVVAGTGYLETLGLIGPGRAASVLAGGAP